MYAFRNIDELLQTLSRERVLLKELFEKRKKLSLRIEDARSLLDWREERLRYLVDSGVVRESGEYLELEDAYLRFFEEVLQVNEQVSVAGVAEIVGAMKDNVEFYLRERNENRRTMYLHAVMRQLKSVSQLAVRGVVDLKRNVDGTYKNEPDYGIKKLRLERLDEQAAALRALIDETERFLREGQPTFFTVAMDVQLQATVQTVRQQLIEASHNIIELERQIILFLTQIERRNRLNEKLHRLKYLSDRLTLLEDSNLEEVVATRNPVWMEQRSKPRIKLSLAYLQTAEEVPALLQGFGAGRLLRGRPLAPPIEPTQEKEAEQSLVDLESLLHSFLAQAEDLWRFLQRYRFATEQALEQRALLFCRLASEYTEALHLTGTLAEDKEYRYLIIKPI